MLSDDDSLALTLALTVFFALLTSVFLYFYLQ